MAGLIESLAGDPETVTLLTEIYGDEIRHVSYATEELNRLADAGHGSLVRQRLRAARRAEARAHRTVSHAFMGRLMSILGAPRLVRFFAGLAIDGSFALRFLFPGGLDQPILADAMQTPERPKTFPTPRLNGISVKTLFLNPPSYEGFDGSAGSRYQARREVARSGIRPGWPRPRPSCRAAS
jgi:hypothetical protein